MNHSPVRAAAVVLLAALFFQFLLTAAIANVPPPENFRRPQPDPVTAPATANLVVKSDREGQTKIVIPRKLVKAAGPANRDTSSLGPVRNVVAGIALSAAIVGVFLVLRRGGARSKQVATALLCFAAVAGVSPVLADIALPRERLPKQQPQIVVQISDDADAVVLVMGKDFPDGRQALTGRSNAGSNEGSAPRE